MITKTLIISWDSCRQSDLDLPIHVFVLVVKIVESMRVVTCRAKVMSDTDISPHLFLLGLTEDAAVRRGVLLSPAAAPHRQCQRRSRWRSHHVG